MLPLQKQHWEGVLAKLASDGEQLPISWTHSLTCQEWTSSRSRCLETVSMVPNLITKKINKKNYKKSTTKNHKNPHIEKSTTNPHTKKSTTKNYKNAHTERKTVAIKKKKWCWEDDFPVPAKQWHVFDQWCARLHRTNTTYSQVLQRHEDQTDSSSLCPRIQGSLTCPIGRTEAPPGVPLQLSHQPQKVRMTSFSVLYMLRKQLTNWGIANNQLKNDKQSLIYQEL